MVVEEMPFFREFAAIFLVGMGKEVYLLQRKTLLEQEGPQGHFQRLLKLHGKVIVIEYYRSTKLEILFVLTGHMVKAGEIRSREKKALKDYLARIKRIEKEDA